MISINQKIENIDISDIESIKLIPNDYKTFQIKSENFYKVVKMILDNTKKTCFEPNELENIYKYILDNYETSLGEETYKKIQEILSIFVKNGGKVEVSYKQKEEIFSPPPPPQEKKSPVKKILITGFLIISVGLGILGAGCGGYFFGKDKIIHGIFAILGLGLTIYIGIVLWKRITWENFRENLKMLGFFGKVIYFLFIISCIVIGLGLAFCGGFGLLSSPFFKYIF